MNVKLKYDPKRVLKLRKNEILSEFRTHFSQKLYEAFKEAETRIWLEKDQSFQFLDEIVEQLGEELSSIREKLSEKAQAWSSVEMAEMNSSDKKAFSVKPLQIKSKKAEKNNSALSTNHGFDEGSAMADINFSMAKSAPEPTYQNDSNANSFDDFDFFDEA